jgi:hypothetical protein
VPRTAHSTLFFLPRSSCPIYIRRSSRKIKTRQSYHQPAPEKKPSSGRPRRKMRVQHNLLFVTAPTRIKETATTSSTSSGRKLGAKQEAAHQVLSSQTSSLSIFFNSSRPVLSPASTSIPSPVSSRHSFNRRRSARLAPTYRRVSKWQLITRQNPSKISDKDKIKVNSPR